MVLVGGHESDHGRDLPDLPGEWPRVHVVPPGRPLVRAVRAALAAQPGTVCLVPMTLGRDPHLVAESARAARWVAGEHDEPARLLVTEPFGTTDHLVGWLRAASGRAGPPDTAMVITAAGAGPFDDAELHRVAALVRHFGRRRLVEVDLSGQEGVRRCRLLGAGSVAVVHAGFGAARLLAARGALDLGPLLSAASVAEVVRSRVATATRAVVAQGDDGIARALVADHERGFAHSHATGHGHGHGHGQSGRPAMTRHLSVN